MNERRKPPEGGSPGERTPVPGEAALPRAQRSSERDASGVGRRSPSERELPAVGRRSPSERELPAIGRRSPSERELSAVGKRTPAAGFSPSTGRTSDPDRNVTPRVTRVLIVDDSPAIVSFVKAYLVWMGCEFVEASDGHRAIRVASLMLVDLVIADINMPGMDGIEMVRAMRQGENARLQRIPIILMTGDASPELERRARDAGTTEFIRKPVDGKELSRTVERLLRQAKASA